ncbi:MAG TPA: hydrolase 2, exosortase A system-associated [Albitalea sp.]|nr:hydrolase 2, exosortase A system-associated [Albitalea sp.]
MSASVRPEVFFLPRSVGKRLCIYHPPAGQVRGALVYVHPLAEEMNKSRRMAALQSRALAAAGMAVLQIDLLGCGDSSGDFGDARWDDWVDDVVAAAAWLQQRCSAPLWLWGLRAGCLVASAAAARLDGPARLVLWQPSLNGKLVLQQFLRLKLASQMLDGSGKAALEQARRELAEGRTVDVAGYALSAALADGIERARLQVPASAERLEWFELSSRDEATLAPASVQALASWQASGCQVRSHLVPGVAFWQTTEIEEAPALIAATLGALSTAPVALVPA